jgi:hypothetical protein
VQIAHIAAMSASRACVVALALIVLSREGADLSHRGDDRREFDTAGQEAPRDRQRSAAGE